ncbi:MAG: TonB-dependent receptor [Roseibacillus sp.]|nr:TonB-dependent receptor [Roseibacillus sp.]
MRPIKVTTCLLGASVLLDQVQGQEIEETVVVANRLETPLQAVGSALTILGGEDLQRRGLVTLENALGLVPGTGIGSEGGQRGSISALRMRGTESDHTLLRIDGVRVSDSNMPPLNLIGADPLFGYSSISVLRGPQSALYGSEAIGGVVDLNTRGGSDEPSRQLFLEAGSFGSLRGGGELQGGGEGVRWYIGGSREQTENDRRANDFRQDLFALRVERDLGAETIAGVTARGWFSNLMNPGSVGSFSGPAEDEREAALLTGYLSHRVNDRLRSHLTAGLYREKFEERGDFPFASDAEKSSLDLRNVVSWDNQHETAVGARAEWTAFRSTATPVDEQGWRNGIYANHLWRPTEKASVSLGGRWENLERWGDSLTWRATGSWQTLGENVRFHGSYGTGFRAPSYFELFGAIPAFNFVGNPDLKAESSRGWDVGMEWKPSEGFLMDLTWFDNRIKNLIDFSPANIGRATTCGIELSAQGKLCDNFLGWRGCYTWQQANDDVTGSRLVRRSRHRASLDLMSEPLKGLLFGAGMTYAAGVEDNDFSAFPSIRKELDSIVLLRAYCTYQVSENVSLHGRVENLLDRSYEEIANYPGRGLGVFGGMRVRW